MSKFVLKIPEVEESISPIEQTKMALEKVKSNVQKTVAGMTKEGWEGNSAQAFNNKTSEWLTSLEGFIGEVDALNKILTTELLPSANASNTDALAFPTYFDGGSGSGSVNTLTLEPGAKDTAVSCCKSMVELYEDSAQSLSEIESGLGELHNPFSPSPSMAKLSAEINKNVEKVTDFSSALDNYATGVNSFDNSVSGSLAQFTSNEVWDEKNLEIAIANNGNLSPEEIENMSEDKRMAYLESVGSTLFDLIPDASFSPGQKFETVVSYVPRVTFFYTVGVDGTYSAGENYLGINVAIDEQREIQSNLSASTALGDVTYNDDGSLSYSVPSKAGETTLTPSLFYDPLANSVTYSVTASNKVEDDNLSVSVSSGMGITAYNSNSSQQPAYAVQPARVPIAVASPEPWYKKAWNSVKDFATEHPVLTTIVVAAVCVAVVAVAAPAIVTGFAAGAAAGGVATGFTAGAMATGGSIIGAASGAVAGGGVALASTAAATFTASTFYGLSKI